MSSDIKVARRTIKLRFSDNNGNNDNNDNNELISAFLSK